MEKEITIYYAVSKTGQGRVFTTLPERNEHFGIWTGRHIGCISMLFMLFEADCGFCPPAITWQDEPVKMTLSLGF